MMCQQKTHFLGMKDTIKRLLPAADARAGRPAAATARRRAPRAGESARRENEGGEDYRREVREREQRHDQAVMPHGSGPSGAGGRDGKNFTKPWWLANARLAVMCACVLAEWRSYTPRQVRGWL